MGHNLRVLSGPTGPDSAQARSLPSNLLQYLTEARLPFFLARMKPDLFIVWLDYCGINRCLSQRINANNPCMNIQQNGVSTFAALVRSADVTHFFLQKGISRKIPK
jgi:hypothetical protein